MEFIKESLIITKKVLNDDTGELESTDFRKVQKTKILKGGFMLTYKDYDTAVCEVINSKKDLEMLVAIRDMFTYAKIEVVLSPTEVAKRFNVSKQKVVTLITKMTKVKLLLRVSKGVYRLNPYMFLPFKSDGELLQQEWKRLVKRLEEPEMRKY